MNREKKLTFQKQEKAKDAFTFALLFDFGEV